VCQRPPGRVAAGKYVSSSWVALSQRRIKPIALGVFRTAMRLECGEGSAARSWPHVRSAAARARAEQM
jgi:hypothetical protein